MNIRKVVAITSLSLFAAAPFAARADAEGKAADACIQAFVSTYLPKGQNVRVRKVGSTAGPMQIYVRRYTVDLSAHAGDGDELVTARCVASAGGEVLALEKPEVVASLE